MCDYNWDFAEATVVCHELGFPGSVEARRGAAFGAGSGPSWYYSVYCIGTELSLNQCSRSSYNFGSACSHSNDAGVVCSSEYQSTLCICYLHKCGCVRAWVGVYCAVVCYSSLYVNLIHTYVCTYVHREILLSW